MVSDPVYTRGRTLWEADVSNEALQQMIVATARASAEVVKWPRGLPARDAARICYDYVTECTNYSREDADQYVRTPLAFVRDAQGDCKSTAVFIGALCRAAGWPVAMRFVQYAGADHYGHVYAVVNGTVVDPLLPFGVECIHLRSKDVQL